MQWSRAFGLVCEVVAQLLRHCIYCLVAENGEGLSGAPEKVGGGVYG